ncbi:MAG: hypothetical protein U0166_27310 [Acidobacteriota bacterium]
MAIPFLKRFAGRADAAADRASRGSADALVMQWFMDALSRRTDPAVLDLGVGKQRQLMNLVNMGFRATGDDTAVQRVGKIVLTSEEDAFKVGPDPGKLFRFDLPSLDFDGVLCWNAFDELSYLGGFLLAREIARLLKVGGVVAGTWSAPPREARRARAEARGFMLTDGRGVHPMRFLDGSPCRYENREILELFPSFKLEHSMVYVDGTRRMVLEKSGQPTLPFSPRG